MSQTGFLSVAGLSLEYERWPAAAPGPTLVLLHEGLGCVALWKSFPQRLHEVTGLDVVAYSRAGYGRSSPVALPRPLDFLEREARDVLPGVLDTLGAGAYVLIGHSDGASIALVYAGAHDDDRLRGLALMAPHVFTEPVTLRTIERAREAFATGELRARLSRYHGENVEGAFRGWAETWTAPGFRRWSIEAHLPAIKVPVVTLRGRDDPYSSDAHVRRIAAAVGGPVERIDLEDCGHAPHLDQPDATLGRVSAFALACRGEPALR